MTLSTADRLALADLVHLYAAAVDDRRFDDVIELFTETAELRLPDPPRTLEPVRSLRGRDGVRTAMAALVAERTEHAIVGEVYADVPEPDYALGRITAIAHHWTRSGDRVTDLVWHLRYDDEYLRTKSGWRIHGRALTINAIETRPQASARCSSSRSSSGSWPFNSFDRASGTESHATRSTSGNSLSLPDPLGHSNSNVLLVLCVTSRSPRTPKAVTILPPGCLTGANSMRGPAGHVEADLLPELALGGDPWVLVLGVLALRNRPGAVVLACPERAAGMTDQHLDDTVGDPVQQKTRAPFRHPDSLGARTAGDQQGVVAHRDTAGTDALCQPFPQLARRSSGQHQMVGVREDQTEPLIAVEVRLAVVVASGDGESRTLEHVVDPTDVQPGSGAAARSRSGGRCAGVHVVAVDRREVVARRIDAETAGSTPAPDDRASDSIRRTLGNATSGSTQWND